jgi:hypothetical protein
MNIFFLDYCPKKAAQQQIDKHIVKMIVESTQMLQTAYSLQELSHISCPRNQSGNVRSHGYYNHPCSLWVRKSLTNFNWLLDHSTYLYEEKKYRFGGDHFCISFIEWAKNNQPQINDCGLTTPALAFKNYPHLQDYNNPVESYQKFYCQDKRRDNSGKWMAKYTKRLIPDFWGKYLDNEQLDEFITMLVENQ